MQLHNKISREELKVKMQNEVRQFTTISFYKYYPIANPPLFRDHLYQLLLACETLGRIYIANEGINAQISVPSEQLKAFKEALNTILFLKDIRLNKAIEEKRTAKSFIKLNIRVRDKIVADGLTDPLFKPHNVGKYLQANQWNKMMEDEQTIVVDMRNHYESEVGRFKGANCPDVETFKEELHVVLNEYVPQVNKNILMYCTGGIRCEKASAWMKHNGFSNVYHLEGGIVNYINQVKEQNLENKFEGVNFVFDDRLSERVSEDVIANCHQCGKPADTHVNCENKGCHTLFIQCNSCKEKYKGCCSEVCIEVLLLPEEEQKIWRKNNPLPNNFTKGKQVKINFLSANKQ